ncbi:hypothetical protein QQG74_09670 [Micromonospora sp. FIMYZ51]|uniref:hypothetical protein n=1 Tax=Micromonospora sp. FIMYZ51 TaxID=3051832 RepID=UPI00311F7020
MRLITAAWLRAWDDLEPAWREAVADLADRAVSGRAWPSPWELSRIARLMQAVNATSRALDGLAVQAQSHITTGAAATVAVVAASEPAVIASQYPAVVAAAAAEQIGGRLVPSALDAIVARTTGQITSLTLPLSAEATEALSRALIRGVAAGEHPNKVARDVLARVQGAFNGGLTRAINVARTEMLDAYRETSRYAHTVNADVLDGWTWHADLGPRCCTACWVMHGRTYPAEVPGPWGHQQCRCARLPRVKPWRELGIEMDEPADLMPNAQARFDALPHARQVAVMGAARLALYRSSAVTWADLATRRDNPGWRPSYVPTPVRDLRRMAGLKPEVP